MKITLKCTCNWDVAFKPPTTSSFLLKWNLTTTGARGCLSATQESLRSTGLIGQRFSTGGTRTCTPRGTPAVAKGYEGKNFF